jgi:hypothetical protein
MQMGGRLDAVPCGIFASEKSSAESSDFERRLQRRLYVSRRRHHARPSRDQRYRPPRASRTRQLEVRQCARSEISGVFYLRLSAGIDVGWRPAWILDHEPAIQSGIHNRRWVTWDIDGVAPIGPRFCVKWWAPWDLNHQIVVTALGLHAPRRLPGGLYCVVAALRCCRA